MKREIVEKCKTCLKENIFKAWNFDIQGYLAKCQYCGETIRMCCSCLNADDNPKHICDWQDGFCSRDEQNEQKNKKKNKKKNNIKSGVVTCGECLFYTPKPDDTLMGKCNYKNRNEVVFEDDFCSRGTTA